MTIAVIDTTGNEFPSTDLRQALHHANSKPKFVLDGFLTIGATLLYGTPDAGKSFMASRMITSLVNGEPFLGREVHETHRVAVCWSDDRGNAEYAERIYNVASDLPDDSVIFYEMSTMKSPEQWERLYQQITADGCTFVVFDVLTQIIGGNFNDPTPIQDFFEGVRLFTRTGIPALVITHSSEKKAENGSMPNTPMGITTLSGSVRWNIHLKKSAGGVWTARQHGKWGKPFTVKFKADVYNVPDFDITDEKDMDDLRTGAVQQQREYDRVKLDTNLSYAVYVVEDCQGMSQRQAADKMAEKFGGSAETMRNLFKRKALPLRQEGDRWALTEEARARLVG